MIVYRNLQHLNTLMLVGTLILCMVFIVEIKDVYQKTCKYHRYQGYKQSIKEILINLNAAEKVMNKSATHLHQLNDAYLKYEKDSKNTSLKEK